MCIAGKKGAIINTPNSLINANEYFYGEDQSRYIVEIDSINLENAGILKAPHPIYFHFYRLWNVNVSLFLCDVVGSFCDLVFPSFMFITC